MPLSGSSRGKKLTPPRWPPEVWPPIGFEPPADEELGRLLALDGERAPLDRAVDYFTAQLTATDEDEHRYRLDPAGWVNDVLDEHMWSKQRAIAEAVRDHRRVAVPSAHEVGKSWLASRVVSWFLSVHPPGEAFVVTTAPSTSQVRAILWREINRAHRKGNLPGRTNQTEWWIDDELVAFGRKPADYSPTAFQGIHAKRVLVVLDEACGIPEEIFRAAQSLIANEYGRMLAIGNPDDASSYFAKICSPDSGWVVIPVSAFDTPNFTGEAVPQGLKEVLVNRIYTDELAADVGEDSPVYVSKALGRFPDDATSGVVPLSFIRECQRLDGDLPPERYLPVELGMDVGAGGDETSVRERRGIKAGRTWRKHTPDWAQACAVLLEAIDVTGATRAKIDVIGIGWGVVGRMNELRKRGRHDCEIVPVDVRNRSYAPHKYHRLRDQLWWEIGRELSRSHGWDLSEVDDATVAQLIAPTWDPDSSGRVLVEEKSQTKKRIRRSPDDADALLLAYYVPPRRQGGPPQTGGQRIYRVPTVRGQPRGNRGRVRDRYGPPPLASRRRG